MDGCGLPRTTHPLQNLLLSVLQNLAIVTVSGGIRHMECITDVYGFAAKVEMALVSKLGADMNPVAARFNIIVVEIAKNMELVRSWSGIVRRATADPTARLTQLEEFKLMTSFVQRYCRAFVEKQSEVVMSWCVWLMAQPHAGGGGALCSSGEQAAVGIGQPARQHAARARTGPRETTGLGWRNEREAQQRVLKPCMLTALTSCCTVVLCCHAALCRFSSRQSAMTQTTTQAAPLTAPTVPNTVHPTVPLSWLLTAHDACLPSSSHAHWGF